MPPAASTSLATPLRDLRADARAAVHLATARSRSSCRRCDANVTITASTGLSGSDGVLLPLEVQTCTTVAAGSLGQYTVLLDPGDTGDDDLAIDACTCSGGAQIFASFNCATRARVASQATIEMAPTQNSARSMLR